MNECVDHVCLCSLRVYSLETYVMNVCVFMHVSYSFYGMHTHIHSLETCVMNVCIHML